MPAGRPTKLTPEAIDEAVHYIDGGYEDEGDIIPSVIGLARILKVGKTTLYRWAEEKPDEFRDILADCNNEQHRILLNKGLSGDVNSTICKLVLGKHGYHDRQEHTGPDGGAVKTQTSVVFVGIDNLESPDT